MQIKTALMVGFLTAVLPCAATAEVWKWRDALGQPAYSNVKERIPPQVAATELQGDIGFLGGEMEGGPVEVNLEGKEPPAPPAAATIEAPTQRQRIRNTQLSGVARYADVFPYWPIYLWQWRDYQRDDPIGTQLWLFNAESELQVRRWGLGS